MSDRSWFYALNGQQNGPCQEGELRALIASGTIRPDTLVWTDGMAGWQKAGEIPGLVSGAASLPGIPQAGGPIMSAGGHQSGYLSADLGVWALFWRSLVLTIGFVFVIPIPWVMTMFSRWFVSCLHVPQRPNLGFTGRPMDLWWLLVAVLASIVASFTDYQLINLLLLPIQILLYWLLLKWFVSKISSDGRELGLTFEGSPWAWIGWQLLLAVSVFTIIGWAWVTSAWLRWAALSIAGTRRAVVFNGSGLEILWRTLVFLVLFAFIIPIPWAMAWYYRWYVSQFALVDRGVHASA